jgi:hypothetical protein
VLLPCYLALPVVLLGFKHDGLLSVLQEMGLGTETGAACFVVGPLETESMANKLFVVVKTGGVILFL